MKIALRVRSKRYCAGAEPAGDAVGVAHEEVAEIDEHAAARSSAIAVKPQRTDLRERVFDRLPLGGVGD